MPDSTPLKTAVPGQTRGDKDGGVQTQTEPAKFPLPLSAVIVGTIHDDPEICANATKPNPSHPPAPPNPKHCPPPR